MEWVVLWSLLGWGYGRILKGVGKKFRVTPDLRWKVAQRLYSGRAMLHIIHLSSFCHPKIDVALKITILGGQKEDKEMMCSIPHSGMINGVGMWPLRTHFLIYLAFPA
jgi:hypothetical protein